MAQSLGSLVVSLGLDSAEFTAGLTRAERQAQQFASRTRSAILEVGKVLGGLAIGNELFQNTKDIISQAAALNDLADATGSTVENLSQLTNQAKIAGTDFATVQANLLKLSAGMAGADDETTKTKEALRLLGITTKDPVQALQEVAVKLNGYADGVNKVGLAVALFGKQGPAFLATLKDIAELQDVGATVSAKQAAEAENLEKAFRRLGVEATTFRNIILSDVVPALTSMIEEILESIRVAGGLLNAFRLFSGLDMGAPAKKIRELTENIAELEKQKTSGGLFSKINNELVQQHIDDANKQIQLLRLVQQRRERELGGAGDPGGVSARAKPPAPFIAGATTGKAIKEKTSDTDKFIESLEKQQQATLELNAEETILVKLWDLQHDGITIVTAAQEKYIRNMAAMIQASADAKKADEDWRKEQEAISRAMDETARNIAHSIDASKQEARQVKEGNDAIREQIAFLTGGDEAVRKLTDAKLADTIAEKERALAIEAGLGATKEQLAAMQGTIDLLKQRQSAVKELDIAKQFAKEAKALQDVKDAISNTFADAFASFIDGTKSAKEAFNDFTKSIAQQVSKVAAQNIGNAIFGGKQEGGPDFFGSIGRLLGLTASTANPVKAATDAAGTAELAVAATSLTTSSASLDSSALALTTSSLGLETSAAGLTASGVALDTLAVALSSAATALAISSASDTAGNLAELAVGFAANGTDFARGGRFMVGEQGPEIVTLPRGARVTPNRAIGSEFGTVTNITMNVMPGASAQTARQAAKAAVDRASALHRRG